MSTMSTHPIGGSSSAATSTATVSGCVEMIQAAVRKVLGKEANLGAWTLKRRGNSCETWFWENSHDLTETSLESVVCNKAE